MFDVVQLIKHTSKGSDYDAGTVILQYVTFGLNEVLSQELYAFSGPSSLQSSQQPTITIATIIGTSNICSTRSFTSGNVHKETRLIVSVYSITYRSVRAQMTRVLYPPVFIVISSASFTTIIYIYILKA